MYAKTLDDFSIAAAKAAFSRDEPLAFFVSAMMAGAYVGIGIILIFTSASRSSRPYAWWWGPVRHRADACRLAGSDLFTGRTMFMTIGLTRGTVDGAAVAVRGSSPGSATCWRRPAGAALRAPAAARRGSRRRSIFAASAAKMGASPSALIARGALCNWLVCLALGTSRRAATTRPNAS